MRTSCRKNKVASLYCSRAVPREIVWLPVMNGDSVGTGQSSLRLDDTDIPGAYLFPKLTCSWGLCDLTSPSAKCYCILDGDCRCYHHSAPEPLANVASCFVLRKAMHGYAWVLCCSIAAHNTHHPAYLIVSNSTTTNAMDSIPSWGKARDVVIFLGNGMLKLMVTWAALETLRIALFALSSMDIRPPSVLRSWCKCNNQNNPNSFTCSNVALPCKDEAFFVVTTVNNWGDTEL